MGILRACPILPANPNVGPLPNSKLVMLMFRTPAFKNTLLSTETRLSRVPNRLAPSLLTQTVKRHRHPLLLLATLFVEPTDSNSQTTQGSTSSLGS